MQENDTGPRKLFELRSPTVPLGSFVIVLLPKDTVPDQDIPLDKVKIIFHGDSLAADLMGPEIAYTLLENDEAVGILLNPDEPIEL